MKTSILNKILAIAFLLSFVANVFLPSIVLLNFKLNQSYIAANLCENKDVKESSCKGKCQLMKSLSKIEKTESKKNKVEVIAETHITSLFLEEIPELFSIGNIFDEKPIITGINLFNSEYQNSLFRPPIMS